MVCSLPSSETLKSFSLRSVTYLPFLSVTTESTTTRRVSVLMTAPLLTGGLESVPCVCAYTPAPAVSKAARNSLTLKFCIVSSCLLHVDGAIFRRYHLPFGIAHH